MNKTLLLIAWALIISTVIIWGVIFVKAYINPSKTVIVDINSAGEAHLELALLGLTLGSIIYLWPTMQREYAHAT